jgi:hypothetical protein
MHGTDHLAGASQQARIHPESVQRFLTKSRAVLAWSALLITVHDRDAMQAACDGHAGGQCSAQQVQAPAPRLSGADRCQPGGPQSVSSAALGCNLAARACFGAHGHAWCVPAGFGAPQR